MRQRLAADSEGCFARGISRFADLLPRLRTRGGCDLHLALPNGRSFLERYPQITVVDLGCDMPDETAGPEWMEKVAARGQFGYLMSVVKLLYESDWEVQRFEEDYTDGVRLSLFRPRLVKADGRAECAK